MRKIVLLLIIILSIELTSGRSDSPLAQERLDRTLQYLGAKGIHAQITVTGQAQSLTSLQHGSSEVGVGDSLETFTALRKRASGAPANLTISGNLPVKFSAGKKLTKKVLDLLGSNTIKQEVSAANFSSAAGFIPGWGDPVAVGGDLINLQVVLTPDYLHNETHFYLTAPDLMTDL